MIELRHVTKNYRSFCAVSDLSVSISPGQCVGLLGPNGAGKTTTIRMITGFIPPSSGNALVGNHDTLSQSIDARRLIGYLPESTPLYGEMRVRDFLWYRSALFSVSRATRRSTVARAMDVCRVTDVAKRRIAHLSKGYRQRVGLAAALVHDPPVLILDEPTSGLDPTQILETRSLVRTLAERRTVLISSHILPEIEQTCDRVLIMAAGRLRADGTPASLRAGVGDETYSIEVAAGDAERADLRDRLTRVVGVLDVRMDTVGPGWTRFRVVPGRGASDLREPLAGACAGRRVRELARHTPSLEQAFVKIIEGDAPAGRAS